MRKLRITTPAADHTIDRWMRHGYVRYPLGVLVIAVTGLLCDALEPLLREDGVVVVLFSAVVVCSALAGFGVGLTVTGLTGLILYLLFGEQLSSARQLVVVCEGVMISIVGAALRSARLKAAERLAANLQLERQIIEIGDNERRRIGHDLHDGLGQHLTGLSLLSETISQQLELNNPPSRDLVESVTRLASEAVGITRDLAKSLAPVTLERDGFVAAVEELAGTVSGMFGVECTWDCDGTDLLPDRTRALHLFRIIQEAVNNSIRHGKATRITVRATGQEGRVRIEIRDNGSGLSEKTMVNPGLGLRIMDYRARMLQAELSIERADAEGGAVVTCTCPEHGDLAAK